MRQMIRAKFLAMVAIPAVLLAGCEQADHSEVAMVESEATYDAAAPQSGPTVDAAADESSAVSASADIPAVMPKLAYIYDFKWSMPGEDIGKLQRAHANLCDQQGPASCQIIGMSKTGDTGDNVTGELQMAVATNHARAFGALLEDEAQDFGAEQLSANIAAEEMSKSIVDTQARLDTRIALRDRLLDTLKTRRGTVAELVEAERGVAQVNEEIDQARSWLREMEGRVAFSRVNIRYETGQAVGGDFLGPVTGALGSVGSIMGYVTAGLILLLALLLPIGAFAFAGRSINRRFGKAEALES